MGDAKGIAPGNKDQNYVLRRLIRRAIRFAFLLGIKENFCLSLAETIINLYKSDYPELIKNKEFINSELSKEEEKFRLTMQKGRKKIHRLVLGFEVDPIKELAEQKRTDVRSKIIKATAKDLFIIFSTYGFPLEMSLEEIKFFESHEFHTVKIEDNIEEKFEAEFKKHQELSRTASAGMFKGGLADDGEMSRKYHTATHLLHQALRDILGDHVEQKGSNINEKRLRFDFVHPDKLTDEEKQKVEELVNQQIQAGLEIVFEEMSVAQAKEQGAIGLFDKKYGEMVKVYKIGKFSKEICGGPHVENTNELGTFKIKKEQSSSAGIRRIKATLK
jgi:alanyl-tRNA synthetase